MNLRIAAMSGLFLGAGLWLGGVSPGWTANTNPTITFQTIRTNQTSPVGKYFSLKLYSVSGFTNRINRLITNGTTNFTTNGTNVSQLVFSNDRVSFGVILTNTNNAPTNLSSLSAIGGLSGLRFDATNGILYGIPTNNFVLSIVAGGMEVVSTNTVWSVTNIFSNRISRATNSGATNTTVQTNTNNPAYRLVFQKRPALSFPYANSNILVGASNALPVTNAAGLPFAYQVVGSNPNASITTNGGTNYLVATNAGTILVNVAVPPSTNDVTWSGASNNYVVLAAYPPEPGFAFVTDTNVASYTRTNLTYLGITPLVLTNGGSARVTFSLNRPGAGRFFVSGGVTNLQALSGTGNIVVTAVRAATTNSAFSQATQSIALGKGSNVITMAGVFSNTATSNITNPTVTRLALLGTARNGTVVFSTSDTNRVRITNGNILLLLANGTSTVVATVTNDNPGLFEAAAPVTNTVVVSWSNPAAPAITSTNSQIGTVGVPFTYSFTATATNTNNFPITLAAAHLPPGLAFTNGNQISGVPTQAGFYRIQLTASNAGGATTGILTSAIAPATGFAVTNEWTNLVALGSGTNTNGVYTVPGLPAGLATNTTNLAGFTQPVLLVTNDNTDTNTAPWFAGVTNLAVVFSNAETVLTSIVTMNIRPGPPALTLTPTVQAPAGILFSLTSTVAPAGLTSIRGYPLSFRASNLPPGLFLNAASGVISGRPLEVGNTTASVWVSNAVGLSTTSTVAFDVPALAGASTRLSVAFTNVPGTYSVENLPPGLILAPFTGLVTGSPQGVGTFSLTVRFVRTGTSTTNTNSQTLTILPSAPLPKVPSQVVIAPTGQPFYFQPWVTGPGWAWAGADPLTNPPLNTALWTNRLLVGTSSILLTSNTNGVLLATTNGLTFTNNTNENTTSILWKANLPASWPWQAMLRLRIPGTLTNGRAEPFLGLFRAQGSFSSDYYDDRAEGFLLSSTSGVLPTAFFASTNATNDASLTSVGTNEVLVRMTFDTNDQALVISVNTNLATNDYTALATHTNVATDWGVTNVAAAMRIWMGSTFSNQVVASNQVILRNFAVLPQGVTFSASNLPAGLFCDPVTGAIHGIPTTSTSSVVSLRAGNGQGTNFLNFTVVVP